MDDKGANDLSNCVPACNSCNSQKWTFTLDQWYTTINPDFTLERLKKIKQWIDVDHKEYRESL